MRGVQCFCVVTIIWLHLRSVASTPTRQLPSTTTTWDTKLGQVLGLNITSENGNIFQFRKIPFAKSPEGDLRFRKPELPNPWNGTLDCTAYGHSCMQRGTNVSEDCLYLNVYVPNSLDVSAKRAVMVWIHGGSFISGTGADYDGSTLALHGDVVVVTINYRLNIFGFYDAGDDAAHGNNGLWDQMLALRWVKNNIADYGGDPSRITIFGESAGGVSVGLQAIISKNKGVFQRVIAESGASVGPRDSGIEAKKVFAKVADDLGCSVDSTAATVTCLRRKGTKQLLGAFYKSFDVVQSSSFTILSALGPTIDGELFTKEFDAILADPDSDAMAFFRGVDFLSGFNTADAGLFYFDLLRHQKEFPSDNFTLGITANISANHVIPTIALQLYGSCGDISKSIFDKYIKDIPKDDIQGQTASAANLYADVNYYSPAVRSLDGHTGGSGRTYQYLFSHLPRWGPVNPRPLWIQGANHADEVAFVFGLNELYPSNVPQEDDELAISSRVMTYWTNFAKFGNPNGNDVDPPAWPQYTLRSKAFLNISTTDTVGHALYADRMEFWNNVVTNHVTKWCDKHMNGVDSNVSLGKVISAVVTIPLVLCKYR